MFIFYDSPPLSSCKEHDAFRIWVVQKSVHLGILEGSQPSSIIILSKLSTSSIGILPKISAISVRFFFMRSRSSMVVNLILRFPSRNQEESSTHSLARSSSPTSLPRAIIMMRRRRRWKGKARGRTTSMWASLCRLGVSCR